MRVTPMAPGDRAAVERLAHLVDVDVDLDAEARRAFARLWVGRLDELEPDLAGFALSWAVADEVHVLNVATHPEHRRRGVGRAMMSAIVERACRDGARLVLLEVRRGNRAAIRLYRSAGFGVIGVRRAYYANDREDALEMMLMIDPDTREVLPPHDEIQLTEV
ncbi:MAG: ribosomal protein S18-alanine N-acetyltransferase [Sorangiineae bacterium]|nr:ribosomal protein S18-alanine N-acetyltransferase [Polyangiaceae bacterium]MEB2320961.1 ribosomal protein S18-alanine N-acetyltransferase [Sorangiineae bacterium]